ncbi:MAG: NAD-dependent epimerase/dehydratase family protein [Sphingomonas bacterium]
MKALVTGANGLIGANLLRELLRAGHEVVGMVRASSDVTHIARLPVRLVFGDVRDPPSLESAAVGCDVIFHTAVHFTYWGHAAGDLARTATEGTRNVIAAARDCGARVVMTSSSVTLGASTIPEVRDETCRAEDGAHEPDYVLAKIAQEREAAACARASGVDLVTACPTMSVGPFGASLGPSNGVITSYLADPLHMTWAGGCNIVSVRDVARGHILLAERGASGERYVLGSENLEWRQVHAEIARLAGVTPPGPPATATACYWVALAEEARARLTGKAPLATRAQARMIGRYYWYDHRRAADLGYAPRPAAEALADAIAWLAAGPHVSRGVRIGMRLARTVQEARIAIMLAERGDAG